LEQAKLRAEAEKKLKQDRQLRAELEAKLTRETAARTEVQEKVEVAWKAVTQARENARLESEAGARMEEKLKAQSLARLKAENKAKTQARLCEEAMKKASAEAEARAEAENKLRAEIEARTRAEADAQAQTQAKAQAKAKARAQEKARTKAERQARAQARKASIAEIREKARAYIEAKLKAKNQKREKAKADAVKKAEAIKKDLEAKTQARKGFVDMPTVSSSSALLALCAKDIMQRNVVWAGGDNSIQQILTTMQQNNTAHVVIGSDGVVEGIVSKSDLTGAISPHMRSAFKRWRQSLDSATLKIKVKWIMSRPSRVVDLQTSVAAIMENMRISGERCLPVTDTKGQVCGLVTTFEILQALLKLKNEPAKKNSTKVLELSLQSKSSSALPEHQLQAL
jgi:CBS domain-containing protein